MPERLRDSMVVAGRELARLLRQGVEKLAARCGAATTRGVTAEPGSTNLAAVNILQHLFALPLVLVQTLGDAVVDALAWTFDIRDEDFPDDDHDWL